MLNLGFINEALQGTLSYFFDEYRFKKQSFLFKRVLYTYLALKCLYWLAWFPLFFGTESIVFNKTFSIGPLNNLAFLLYNQQSGLLNAICIVFIMAACLFFSFYRKQVFIVDFLLWFLVLNLHNTVYPVLSGGDYLLNQFLLFNCFLSFNHINASNAASQLRVLLHNIGCIAIIAQVCLAYLLSALAKLSVEQWLNGEAIGSIARINHFNLYSFPGYHPQFNRLYVVFTYLTLLYQLVFPVLCWIKFLKKPFLITGVFMHLYIAFVMGLPWFAGVMIIGYIFFWPFSKTRL